MFKFILNCCLMKTSSPAADVRSFQKGFFGVGREERKGKF